MLSSNKILVLGHRGAPLKEIENTIPSFKRAISDGADGVELDVRLTKDNHLIVSHDNSLKRVYGIDLKVEESTLSQIKESAPDICLLSDVFDSLGTIWYDIEIKTTQPLDFRKEIITLLVKELENRPNLKNKIVVSSFNPFCMHLFAKKSNNAFPMGIIYDKEMSPFGALLKHGQGRILFPCSFLKPKWDIATVEKKKKEKYPVCPWTVDTIEVLDEMLLLNPPIIITNDSETIVNTLKAKKLR